MECAAEAQKHDCLGSRLKAGAAQSALDSPYRRTHDRRCLEHSQPYWHDKETLAWIVAGNGPGPATTMPTSIRSPTISETECVESEQVCADEPEIEHPSGVSARLVPPLASTLLPCRNVNVTDMPAPGTASAKAKSLFIVQAFGTTAATAAVSELALTPEETAPNRVPGA